jgi:predicted RNase H-like HicB family nuclease
LLREEERRYHCVMDKDSGSRFRVVLVESEEGFAASCPSLRGCHSQGATREEALENIRDAIREWLAAEADERSRVHVIEAEVVI